MGLETSVSELKETEEKAVSEVNSARENKEKRLKDARNEAASLMDKGRKDATKLKDKLLADTRKEIEAEVKKIGAKAKNDADKIRHKKVPADTAKKIAKKLFKGLVD